MKSKQRPTLWNYWIRLRLLPLFLIITSPIGIFLLWDINSNFAGKFGPWYTHLVQTGLIKYLHNLFVPLLLPSAHIWAGLFGYIAFQVALYHLLPGEKYQGPATLTGYRPKYKNNGFLAFIITFTLYIGATLGGWIPLSYIYDHFSQYLMATNQFGLVFCLFLYFKGRYAPSSRDNGTSGSFIFDYYWGTELYPEIFNTPIKIITNCRFGMMLWPVLITAFFFKQIEVYGLHDSMLVSTALQLIYLAKFFLWEKGYMHTTDIIHDRLGFYIGWGCLVFVPGLYTCPSSYLVHNPITLGLPYATAIFCLGVLAISVNYLADLQRIKARSGKKDIKIWGKKPRLIHAEYINENSKQSKSILLASGFWGLARHFHYFPELAAAFLWSVPAGFVTITPYIYFIVLFILLVHRVERDEARCSKKYGKYWKEYCRLVKYKIVPYLY